jgi:hypothetical protein
MLFCDRYYVKFNIFLAFGMMTNWHTNKNLILGDHGREAF